MKRRAQRSPLSPRGAAVVGVCCGGMGAFVMLASLGAFPSAPLTPGTPVWVGVLAGLMFFLAGLAVIVGYAIGRAGTHGDLTADTPWRIRVTKYVLGLSMTTSLAL